jgi:hypothetical protein
MTSHPDPERNETETERADRNLRELLEELRVAIPGVQVLFAFLLTVPFAQRFAAVTPFQQRVYFATLLCSAAASRRRTTGSSSASATSDTWSGRRTAFRSSG